MKKRVLSGIRSTGQLHLGNYFGALRNFVKLQDEAECYFFIADYHSLTTHPDPTILHSNVRNILSEYLAAGIDPEKATIYVQSDVPEVAELSLLLVCTPMSASWSVRLRSRTRCARTPTM